MVRGGGAAGLRGRVTLTEVIAPDEYATIAVGDITLRARVASEDLTVDDEVGLTFARSYLLFFDPETGGRLDLPTQARAAEPARREAIAG